MHCASSRSRVLRGRAAKDGRGSYRRDPPSRGFGKLLPNRQAYWPNGLSIPRARFLPCWHPNVIWRVGSQQPSASCLGNTCRLALRLCRLRWVISVGSLPAVLGNIKNDAVRILELAFKITVALVPEVKEKFAAIFFNQLLRFR